MSCLSIRERQAAAIRRMLNFNSPPPPRKSSLAEPAWKVLVYDRFGQDIISPLLSVRELRDAGVTLHLPLHAHKEPVGDHDDVPAVYFVMPTEENVARVCRDVREGLYARYHLNFISAVGRSRLEEIAGAAVAAGAVERIAKVYDQYLNFVALEDDMFVLAPQSSELVSYRAINRADLGGDGGHGGGGEAECAAVEAIADAVADGLFCFFVTLGTVPVIRCPRGNAAEMVAAKLDKRLRENLRDARNRLFTGGGDGGATAAGAVPGQFSFHRPLLLLADRNLDLATPLHHASTYQAMIHDVLDLHLNRVTVETEEGAGPEEGDRPKTDDNHNKKKKKKSRKSFELCAAADKIWQSHRGSPFPELAESVQTELESYRAQGDKVKRLKSAMGLEEEEEEGGEGSGGGVLLPPVSSSDSTAALTSAMGSLPELLEKKRVIALHTDVSTALCEHVRRRKLDMYFEYERKLMSRSNAGTAPPPDRSLLDVIADPDAGTPEDKMRLFLIHYVTQSSSPSCPADLEQYEKALRDAGCDLSPLAYVRRWKAFEKENETRNVSAQPWSTGGVNNKPMGLLSRVMNSGSQLVMEGVRNLVVPPGGGGGAQQHHHLPLTRALDSLVETRSHPDTDHYRYFDPKTLRDGEGCSPSRYKGPFQEAVVFVVGGGNYVEYQNLADYAKSKRGQRVLYGCSELLNATQFLEQLSQLGQNVK